jgi:PleD family two-component response regulator
MAQGSGFETLVTLRKEAETSNIPIIILSIVDQRQVGFALGATDYLVKPIRKAGRALGNYEQASSVKWEGCTFGTTCR